MRSAIPDARLILASTSPRRREILSRLGARFDVVAPIGVDESSVSGEPEEVARVLAARKAVSVLETVGDDDTTAVLGADTVVAVRGRGGWDLLGSPSSPPEARRMLRLLSGRRHEVWTAVALARPRRAVRVEAERSAVEFHELSEDRIEEYISTGEPFGKAGGYGIQGLGGALVSGFEGCYWNIVGLPLVRVARILPPGTASTSTDVCGCASHPLQRGSAGCLAPRGP